MIEASAVGSVRLVTLRMCSMLIHSLVNMDAPVLTDHQSKKIDRAMEGACLLLGQYFKSRVGCGFSSIPSSCWSICLGSLLSLSRPMIGGVSATMTHSWKSLRMSIFKRRSFLDVFLLSPHLSLLLCYAAEFLGEGSPPSDGCHHPFATSNHTPL